MAVAVYCWVAPGATVAVEGVTEMVESVLTGAVTDIFADPLTPLRVAMMVAEPAVSAFASPEVLTVATEVLEDDQVTVEETAAVVLSL